MGLLVATFTRPGHQSPRKVVAISVFTLWVEGWGLFRSQGVGPSAWKKTQWRHLQEAEAVILSVYALDPVCMI